MEKDFRNDVELWLWLDSDKLVEKFKSNKKESLSMSL